MLSGLLAGLVTVVFAQVFGEPLVDEAMAFEDHLRELAGNPPEPELVSRALQSTVGLLTGIVIYACALGGIFALVFAYARGRVGRIGGRGVAALLAAAAFVVLFLVPQIKYPANPPSIGDPETIQARTALYFGVIVWSVAAAVAALLVGRRILPRLGVWNATLCGGAVYVAAIAVAMAAFPIVNEVPREFPATLLWQFRVVSLGGHAVLLTTLGLVFGAWSERPTEAAESGLRPFQRGWK
jgi:hypothetical protein